MTDEYTFAPQYEYPGQWFDDMGAVLLATEHVGLAWDTMKANLSREDLDGLIFRLGSAGATEGDLEE